MRMRKVMIKTAQVTPFMNQYQFAKKINIRIVAIIQPTIKYFFQNLFLKYLFYSRIFSPLSKKGLNQIPNVHYQCYLRKNLIYNKINLFLPKRVLNLLIFFAQITQVKVASQMWNFKYNVNQNMKSRVLFLILVLLIGYSQAANLEQNKPAEVQEVKPIVINAKQSSNAEHHKDQVPATPSSPPPPTVLPVEQAKSPAKKESNFTFDNSNTFSSDFIEQSNTSSNQQAQGPNSDFAFETQREIQLEVQKHEEEVEEEQRNLRPWILEEIKSLEHQTDGIVTESFQFVLDPEASYNFRWDPPRTQMLSINVLVFQILENGEIMMEHDLEESELIEVDMREEGHTYFNSLGHVYVSKIFRIDFDTDFKYFKFTSHMPRSVFVVVDLEKTHEVIPKETVAQNHHFQLPLEKLKVIEEQVESGEKIREHTYKYEWGFLDNQYAHDSRLLGLTGFELVVIMGAAILQLYFIKNLLDNRAVV